MLRWVAITSDSVAGQLGQHLGIVDQLVHSSGPQGGPDNISHCCTGIYIADQLWGSLAGVRSIFEQNDLRGLQTCECDRQPGTALDARHDDQQASFTKNTDI